MAKVVFTNGCFDVLHPGHIDLLARAKALGDRLIVGINSDRSVRALKGPGRPVFSEHDRKKVLLALDSVDEVRVFDDQTPQLLIEEIGPDVLVKGGDWKVEEIVGSDHVRARGGEVVSLPLVDGYSSTAAINAIQGARKHDNQIDRNNDVVAASLNEHLRTFESVIDTLPDDIRSCGEILISTLKAGNKILVCGNGGSAADAQHIAAEFVGRYETERVSLPAIALTTDTSALTAIGNDYGFEYMFARQVESLAREGDCLIAISTSGNSPNVIAAMMKARTAGCRVIGLTGEGGKKLAGLSDASILVPSERTARIQEAHITIAHIWCEMVDHAFA
ncbi:MAG TPA: SIS domain-containing protein [Pyrinomonadaceae bacterium]